ncbi:NUDIX hydrolase [Tessaracoccus sp. Z1128]
MADRPVTRRLAARVIVLAGDDVLLLGDTDPGVPGSRFWQAPGGGVEPRERVRSAAARELEEETGLIVDEGQLVGPVAVRRLFRGYSDRILIQEETFFRYHTQRFEPVSAGLTRRERSRHVSSAWFPLDALPEHTWPAEIATLARWDGEVPVDLGDVEESTVPVGELPL